MCWFWRGHHLVQPTNGNLSPSTHFAATAHRPPEHSSPDAAVMESGVLTFLPPCVFPDVEKHSVKLCGLKSLLY